MTSPPLVSVVIPSYNHERFVGEAIASVYRQTYPRLELVVVDDGSTDGSRALVASLLAECPLERGVLLEQPNAGAHAALNRGVEASSGDVVAILNSDDLFAPERLERLVAALRGAGGGVVFSRLDLVDAAGHALPPKDPWRRWYTGALQGVLDSPTVGFALLLANVAVSSSNFVFSRELWRAVGPFSSHRFCHDWDFLMRSVLLAEPVLVDEPLLRYRVHATNSTASLRDVQEAEVGDALNRYLEAALAGPARNPLAPTPAAWPHLLPRFVEGRCFHFGTHAIARYVRPELWARVAAAAASAAA